MADFKTHTLVGSGVGVSLGYLAYIRDWTHQLPFFLLIYISAIIGSFLPDLDADTGRPIRIIFTFFGLVFGGLALAVGYFVLELSWRDVIIMTIGSFLIVRYLLGFLFRKITKHRGIYHSIPVMLISFFVTLSIVDMFNFSIFVKFAISIAVLFGFLSHLVLDEVFATKSFMGIPYKVNGSFGNSVKFFAKSKKSTVLAYVILISLFILNYDNLIEMFNKLL